MYAVIVNDMSEVNIDKDLVADSGDYRRFTDEKLVELSNGCICLHLENDLLKEVERLERVKKGGMRSNCSCGSTGSSSTRYLFTTFLIY